jgi:hypothetical protein
MVKKAGGKSKARAVIPIDFKEPVVELLRQAAELEGMSLAAFLRHLILTHPKISNQYKKIAAVGNEIYKK